MDARGVLASLLLPLGAVGAGLAAHFEQAQRESADAYAAAVDRTRGALHMTAPEPAAPRPAGEVDCWQLSDHSVREAYVFSDERGNIYLQDGQGRLRMLRLKPGFRLGDDTGEDWMSRRLADAARPAGSWL